MNRKAKNRFGMPERGGLVIWHRTTHQRSSGVTIFFGGFTKRRGFMFSILGYRG